MILPVHPLLDVDPTTKCERCNDLRPIKEVAVERRSPYRVICEDRDACLRRQIQRKRKAKRASR